MSGLEMDFLSDDRWADIDSVAAIHVSIVSADLLPVIVGACVIATIHRAVVARCGASMCQSYREHGAGVNASQTK